MTTRVAMIGAGIFAKETYFPHFNGNSSKVKLTAILSRTPESIESALQLLREGIDDVARFVGSVGEEDFFSQVKDICDAVIIVVPIPMLSRYIERCLTLGLHILSEKPVSMSSIEATRLISMYRGGVSGEGRWHVAENYRLEPAVLYAQKIVANHHLQPKTFSLTALRQQSASSKYAVTSWRAQPEYNGSFVLDGGIHFIAMMRAILGGAVRDIRATYEEQSVVEVGTCGSCRIGPALGTFQIRYGAFAAVVCRLDVYWDDAILSIIQHKGVGYEVVMTGEETKAFPFGGLEEEFKIWLDTLGGVEASELSPEEALADLLVVEDMCKPH